MTKNEKTPYTDKNKGKTTPETNKGTGTTKPTTGTTTTGGNKFGTGKPGSTNTNRK